jgi:hypothetical protein
MLIIRNNDLQRRSEASIMASALSMNLVGLNSYYLPLAHLTEDPNFP